MGEILAVTSAGEIGFRVSSPQLFELRAVADHELAAALQG
jgi:hypothetical protein